MRATRLRALARAGPRAAEAEGGGAGVGRVAWERVGLLAKRVGWAWLLGSWAGLVWGLGLNFGSLFLTQTKFEFK